MSSSPDVVTGGNDDARAQEVAHGLATEPDSSDSAPKLAPPHIRVLMDALTRWSSEGGDLDEHDVVAHWGVGDPWIRG